jgi:catalase
MHRQSIARGRVSYEPNSLGGGCPFQAGAAHGFVTVPEKIQAKEEQAKVRAKPEKFADHYTQAQLFFDSQTPVEQAHIAAAFRFELSKVQVPAIRERMVASLRNVSEPLARRVAEGLGMKTMPETMPKALEQAATPEVTNSPMLSLKARPGDGSITARKVAILVAPGIVGQTAFKVHAALFAEGAVPRFVGPHIGPIETADGVALEADASFENEPGFLFDGLVLPDGADGVGELAAVGQAMDFVADQYRHGKPIMVMGASAMLLDQAGIPVDLPNGQADPGIVVDDGTGAAALAFIRALEAHRHPERETDPPMV